MKRKMLHVEPLKSPPGPHGHPLFGNLGALRQDGLRFLLEISRQYGDVVQYRMGHRRIYLVNHPDLIQQVLQDNHRNYTKETLFYNLTGYMATESRVGQSVNHFARSF